MRTVIKDRRFDEERSLYALEHCDVVDCVFAGPADGESVLKEARDVALERCDFSLRYPLWHVRGFKLKDCRMDELTRAAIWYAEGGEICDSILGGIKAVRECKDISIKGTERQPRLSQQVTTQSSLLSRLCLIHVSEIH